MDSKIKDGKQSHSKLTQQSKVDRLQGRRSALAMLAYRKKGREIAHAMLTRLYKEQDLVEACDPGYDYGSRVRPIHNIVLEYLDAAHNKGHREYVEGFCEVLTGFVAVSAGGCAPTDDNIIELFRVRERCEREVAVAQADTRFQTFLEGIGASDTAGDMSPRTSASS